MADSVKFDKIESKIDVISEDITEIKLIMARNTSSLEDHMRRTDLNEKAIEKMFGELKPVQTHVIKVDGVMTFLLGAAKILGGIAALISIILGLYTLLSKIM